MKNCQTVIVDDEIKSTDILTYLIEKHCPALKVEAVFNAPYQALEYLKNNKIDLLLLDIQMPELDGFELLDKLPEIDFNVVFITAYDEFALKAFQYYAIDYILKPVEVEKLKRLTERLTKKEMPRYDKSDFLQIFEHLNNPQPVQHLSVPTNKGIAFVLLENILRLQADSNYTYIIKNDGTKIYASKTLKFFENLLPANLFFRPHQSHIINIQYMDEFVRSDGGHIRMIDGVEIALARSKKQEFISRFIS